jgi:hypothetical protein
MRIRLVILLLVVTMLALPEFFWLLILLIVLLALMLPRNSLERWQQRGEGLWEFLGRHRTLVAVSSVLLFVLPGLLGLSAALWPDGGSRVLIEALVSKWPDQSNLDRMVGKSPAPSSTGVAASGLGPSTVDSSLPSDSTPKGTGPLGSSSPSSLTREALWRGVGVGVSAFAVFAVPVFLGALVTLLIEKAVLEVNTLRVRESLSDFIKDRDTYISGRIVTEIYKILREQSPERTLSGPQVVEVRERVKKVVDEAARTWDSQLKERVKERLDAIDLTDETD